MCFAPEADAAVGVIVVAVGVDALRHVRTPRQIPLASLPVLFGVHQLSEAFVWWDLQGHVAHSIGRVATWGYLLFALAVLPILLPLAVGLIERSPLRVRVIAACGALAGVVGVTLALAVVRGPIHATIDGRHIEYQLDSVQHGGQLTALYVTATCGALLVSSYRELAAFGALNLVVVPVLMWLTVDGFISLWCFWAAIASVVIAYHLRRWRGARSTFGRMSEDVKVERTIAAAPEKVWAMVSDVTRMGEWSPETVGCEWIGDRKEPAVGARFKGNNENGKRKWSTVCTVVEASPGESFAFDVKAGPFNIARWAYRFEAANDGCRLTESWTDRRPKLIEIISKPVMGVSDRGAHNRETMQATLDRLAAAAEA